MRFILISWALALGLTSAASAAGKLPTIPAGCFDDKLYCTETAVVDASDGHRVIRVKFVAMTTINEFPTAQSIVDKYFSFGDWFDYARGTDAIKIEQSALRGVEGDNDKLFHYSRYIVQAPFPINKSRVREVSQYNRMTPVPGAVISYSYSLVQSSHTNLPEEDVKWKTLNGSEGVKRKDGEIHIQFNEETGEYYLFMVTDVIPGIDLLPKVAAPYIERGIVAVAKGMLNL